MSRAVNMAARVLLGLKARDCSGSYRCYRTRLLADIDFGAILSRGYSFQEEILFLLTRQGAKIEETPITFVDRQRGQSKINSGEALDAGRILIQLGLGRCRRSVATSASHSAGLG
jgi:dolichol-phosphate mannosyltransferase